MTERRRTALAAALVIAAGVLVRIPTLGQPLLEVHSFRQTQTAYQALIFHESGIDLLHPQVPVLGPPFQLPFEFPLFQALASLPMAIGVPPDSALRLTSLICFVIAAILLWRLVERLAGEIPAIATLIVFLFSPFTLVWSRTSMIEYLVVAASLGYLTLGIAWREERRWWQWLGAAVAGVVATTVKITSGFPWALPLLFYRPRREASLRDPLLVLLLSLPIAAGLVWTRYADGVRAAGAGTSWMTSVALADFLFGPPLERIEPGAWFFILLIWIGTVIGPALVGALAASRSALRSGPQRTFWIAFVAAPLVSVAIFFNLYRLHDYYSAALTPSLLVAVGFGAAVLWTRADLVRASLPIFAVIVPLGFVALPLPWALLLAAATAAVAIGAWQLRRSAMFAPSRLLPAVAALVVAANLASTWLYWGVAYGSEDAANEAAVFPRAAELARVTRPDEWAIVVGHDWQPDILYYARRRGQMLPEPLLEQGFVDALPIERYPVFMAWDPLVDPLWPVARARWIGPIGPHTWALGSSFAELRGAAMAATDDEAAFAAAALRAARPLVDQPFTLGCDRDVSIPRGSSGTWLHLQAAPRDARLRVSTDLAPIPARGVIFLAANIDTGHVRCIGAGSLRVLAIIDAPPPR